MAIKFQGFAIYGPEFRNEACHRKLNLDLVVDAMRAMLEKEEFRVREFVNDVNAENNVPNELDGMRYKSAQKCSSAQKFTTFAIHLQVRTTTYQHRLAPSPLFHQSPITSSESISSCQCCHSISA